MTCAPPRLFAACSSLVPCAAKASALGLARCGSRIAVRAAGGARGRGLEARSWPRAGVVAVAGDEGDEAEAGEFAAGGGRWPGIGADPSAGVAGPVTMLTMSAVPRRCVPRSWWPGYPIGPGR